MYILSGSSLHLNYFYLKKPQAEFTLKLFLPEKTWVEFTIDLLKTFFPRAEITIAPFFTGTTSSGIFTSNLHGKDYLLLL
jgi:hypothetical protein